MQADITAIKETLNSFQKSMNVFMDTIATAILEVRDNVVHITKNLKLNPPSSKVETNEDADKSFQSDLSSASKSANDSNLSSGSNDTAPIKYNGTNPNGMLSKIFKSK